MPRIRAEQLQGLTLTNDQISDGQLYDANGIVIDAFDPARLIDQEKIKNLDYQPNGWISRGIINKVETLPEWESEFEGRLFYVNVSDQLYLGIGTDPWFILISGSSSSGWDAELTVRTGFDGMDWNGTMATTFQTLSYNFSEDGSDLFVYMNGNLQRLGHDYTLVDQRSIRLTRNAYENDTVTMLVHISNSMLNYATKAWVFEKIQSGGIQHSLDAAYDDGSIVSVDATNVDFRLAPTSSFVVSEAISGVDTPASNLGTEAFPAGYNWQSKNQSFDVTTRIAGNTVGPNRILLNAPAITSAEVATEISEALVSFGSNDVFAYVDNNHIGLQSTAIGSDVSFEIVSGTNMLPIIGIPAGFSQGDDAYSSYQNFGLGITPSDPSGLEDTERFWFAVEGTEYSINTGVGTTYDQLRSLMDAEIDAAGYTATTETDDIRITRDQPGLPYPTLVEEVSYSGQIEITQVTTVADVDRSLSEKYFNITAIDNGLFGHEKPYYAWYHLDAEQEVTEITVTAEDSNVTLANKYFTLSSPNEDYYVWFEVETPQTAGYQELGLAGVDASTDTGLIKETAYSFEASVDGSLAQDFNFTTPPDIQPTAEITEITMVADIDKSLSGKYFTLNSQSGNGYYVWYNIDTPAGSESTEITAVADIAQSLSGKSFTIHSTTQQYYAWVGIETDPGITGANEITEVTTSGDTAQSLSGKYFNINSYDGTQAYVWYEMLTDAGITAGQEVSEVAVTADSGQSLSSKYFGFSSPSTDYYAWYRMQTADPIVGEKEVTDVILPADTAKSLSGKYWTFNTPYNDYYVWYRTELTAMIPATSEISTFTMDSNTLADYTGQSFRFYNFGDAYDVWFDITGSDVEPGGLTNAIKVDISADSVATEFALSVANAITAAGIPFTATNVSASVEIECSNAGEQTNAPTGNTDVSVIVTTPGVDMTPATFSNNPAPAGKTGVQINYTADSANTVIASLTEAQITLLSDVTTALNGATVTISNVDNGAVIDAANFDAGVVPSVTTPGITSEAAQFSTNPINNPPIPGTPENTEVYLPSFATPMDIEGTYWTFNTPSTNYYVWYRMQTETYTSGTPSTQEVMVMDEFPINYQGGYFRIYDVNTPYDFWFNVDDNSSAPAGLTNPTEIKLYTASPGVMDIMTSISAAMVSLPAMVTDNGTDTISIESGEMDYALQFAPVDNSPVTSSVMDWGMDAIFDTWSTDPAIAGATGIQVDMLDIDDAMVVNDNTVSALGTANVAVTDLHMADDITYPDYTLLITNNVAGAVDDASGGNSGAFVNILTQGVDEVTLVGKTGIVVDILMNADSNTVASLTATAINLLPDFEAYVPTLNKVEITALDVGNVNDVIAGDSGFGVTVTTSGVDYIAPSYSADPAPVARSGIKVQIVEDDDSLTVAEATKVAIDTSISFTASRANSVVTILDQSIGAISNAFDTDSGFGIAVTQEGVDYVAPTYTADPGGVGTGILIPVNENDSDILVAQSIENAFNAHPDFSATRTNGLVTIENMVAGFATDAVDIDSGFGITVAEQGYEAYSSIDPAVIGKTGLKATIIANDSGEQVATKTQILLNANNDFVASVSGLITTIVDANMGPVADAADVDTGFGIATTDQGHDLIPADVTWGNVVNMLNAITTSSATWILHSGDVRFISDTIGSWTAAELQSSVSYTDFFTSISGFTALETAAAGSSSYSADPAATGISKKVPILIGSDADSVATVLRATIEDISDISSTISTNIVTAVCDDAGIASDCVDSGTLFSFNKVNQGADESIDPAIAGKTGIKIDIEKHDDADTVATKTQATVDVFGEFYVTRLNNVISIQNDFAGSVAPAVDVSTGFILTQTGLGEDVKYSLLGVNGLDETLPAAVDGIDAIPASTPLGTGDLNAGYNFYTFPKDFAVSISSEPILEIFFDEAVYNASEAVTSMNAKILAAGTVNLEAYQSGGYIGLRTVQVGLSQTIDLMDSLSDALVTLGWDAGLYAGDYGNADSIMEVTALAGENEIIIDANILPKDMGAQDIGSETAKFRNIYAQEGHFDAGTVYVGDTSIFEAEGKLEIDSTVKFSTVETIGNVNVGGNVIGPNTTGSKIDNFEKIYNAVWNDIADFITVEDECEIEFGKCYFMDKDFTHKQTTSAAQKGMLGIASDTYGYGLGKDKTKKQLPLAVGGFVLAYVVGDVEPGDALTSGINGTLTIMTAEDKALYPERMVATYYKPEPLLDYNGIVVGGRHWVKVC